MSLKGTQTGKNLVAAVAGESPAGNCGRLHENMETPEQCDACAHPRAHFEILGENY